MYNKNDIIRSIQKAKIFIDVVTEICIQSGVTLHCDTPALLALPSTIEYVLFLRSILDQKFIMTHSVYAGFDIILANAQHHFPL